MDRPLKVKNTFPVCMEQYTRLFGTCRIPGISCDTLHCNPNSKHIIVWVRSHPYLLELYNVKGEEISLEELDTRLLAIKKHAVENSSDEVCYLTSQDRDAWATDRALLLQTADNVETLKLIEDAMFMVCFDDASPETLEEQVQGGLLVAGNRWHDATMTTVIYHNGRVVSHMEHSGLDASPFDWLLQSVLDKESTFATRVQGGPSADPTPVKPLQWNLSEELQGKIITAKETLQRELGDYKLRVLEFNDYGTNFIKGIHFSPDGFTQMALQLAYFKLHGRLVFTYESAATRLFYHGRTETVRSVTEASAAFVQAMMEPKRDEDKVRELLRQAVAGHSDYTRRAYLGEGVDRHLFGLKIEATEQGLEPEFFKDKAFTLPSLLSTSQTECKNFPGGGFFPAHPDGYGVFYVEHPNELIFHISSKGSSQLSNSNEFMEILRTTLVEMAALYSS